MIVKELLLKVIDDNTGLPVYLQGSLSDTSAYPESFFTFWNNDTIDGEFYDNAENVTTWDFDLNFYSSDVKLVNTILEDLKRPLTEAGFIVDGVGYDLLSDVDTHTGRGINIIYQEQK